QHKLMQIILAGQPELRERLQQPELRQLRQRVMVHCDLATLTSIETALYIRHRLNVAGAGERISFTPSAIDLIYRRTGGIPCQINTLCDRSLLAAYVRKDFEVSARDVETAVQELASVIQGGGLE
ncbi:MAG TPA: hypothetical protein VJ904_04250, partial [Tichowtungia sp.]|nr:hypothetical protein [Tichowtungia sp.]